MRALAPLVASSLALTSGMVCPPFAETKELKLEGERCGGACDTIGTCADGLECDMPKSSMFSFVILSSPNEGVCKPLEKKHGPMMVVDPLPKPTLYTPLPVEDAQDLKNVAMRKVNEGKRQMMGGASEIDIDDADLKLVAKHGFELAIRSYNGLVKPTLGKIISAKKQVVSGLKYTLVAEFNEQSGAARHQIEVLDQPWATPRFTLLKDEVLNDLA